MNHQSNPRYTFIVILILGLSLMACVPSSKKVSIPTPHPGKAIITGKIVNLNDYWETETVSIFLADYYENEFGEGFFTLDAYSDPIAQVQLSGHFISLELNPGNYVLVVGTTPEESHLIVQDDQQVLVLSLIADQRVDLGNIKLK